MVRVSIVIGLLTAGSPIIGCGEDAEPLRTVPDLEDERPDLPSEMGGTISEACQRCADALVDETSLCGPALEVCVLDPTIEVEALVACFIDDGRCYDEALARSSICHGACGDAEQARVETCARTCFTDRARCAETAVRDADRCLDTCPTRLDCDLCSARAQLDFDVCNRNGQACADTCVATHRGS